jgi:serine/threonine protein kinase
MVLELIKGMSLKAFMATLEQHKLSEARAIPLFRQTVSAIAYCHLKGVAHRDLKLDNILLTTRNVIKVIDFGFSIFTKQQRKCKVFCGTPTYMAPEIINKAEYSGPGADVWALGVILYALLCGCFPFRSIGC